MAYVPQPREQELQRGLTVEETHAHQALRRVVAEQEHVGKKSEAFKRFREEVSGVPTETSGSGGFGATTATGGGGIATTLTNTTPTRDGCRRVLALFDETVRPQSVEDIKGSEPLVETLAEELGRDVAYSLSSSEGAFTKELKTALLSATADREAELCAMEKALEKEEESVRSALETVENASGSELASLGGSEGALLGMGFDELREAHAETSELGEESERAVEERQKTLHETTNNGAAAGVEHHELVGYLYEDFPTEYPVLFTLTKLKELCEERGRAVRDSLCRTL